MDTNEYLGRLAVNLQNRLIEIAGDQRGVYRDFEPGTSPCVSRIPLTMDKAHDEYLLNWFVDEFTIQLSDLACWGPVRWWKLPVVEIEALPDPGHHFYDLFADNGEVTAWRPRSLVVSYSLET